MTNKHIAPRIPARERKKLSSQLRKHAALAPHQRNPINVREAFPLGLDVKTTSESTISQLARSRDSLNTASNQNLEFGIHDNKIKQSLLAKLNTRRATGSSIVSDCSTPDSNADTPTSFKSMIHTEDVASIRSAPSTIGRKGGIGGFFSPRGSTSDRKNEGRHARNSTSRSRISVTQPRALFDLSYSSDESEYSFQSSSSQSLNEPYNILLAYNGHTFYDAAEDQNESTDLVNCRFCKGYGELLLKCSICSLHVHGHCAEIVQGHPCKSIFNECKLQLAFFKVFTSLLKNYRFYLIPDSVDEYFKKDEFIGMADKECRPFYTLFLDSHAFTQFIVERVEREESDFEILFFDEALKAKRNRSKFKRQKETTPFLQDQTYAVTQTIYALEPNMEGLSSTKIDYSPRVFPSSLNPCHLIAARKIKPLATASDQKIMKSRTAEMVRRAHTGTKRKGFENWIKGKMSKLTGHDGELISLGLYNDEQRM
jgi:hypothetical protein